MLVVSEPPFSFVVFRWRINYIMKYFPVRANRDTNIVYGEVAEFNYRFSDIWSLDSKASFSKVERRIKLHFELQAILIEGMLFGLPYPLSWLLARTVCLMFMTIVICFRYDVHA